MRITLDTPLFAEEIRRATGALTDILGEQEFWHICTSSKEAEPNDLFVAIRGESFDGNEFAKEAVSRGAYALCEKNIPSSFTVKDSRAALFSLAKLYKSHLQRLVATVAITGSVGKSTTKEFTRALLQEKYKTHATAGNENNQVGVPLTLFKAPKDTEVLIIEAGMNHAGELDEISRCISPTIAAITNVGTAHIGNLGSRKSIAKAKLELTNGMNGGSVILPFDEPLLKGIENGIYLSKKDHAAYSYFLNEKNLPSESVFDYISKFNKIEGARLSLGGAHLVSCLQFAIAISELSGLTKEEIVRGISSINSNNIRQKYINISDFRIYDDSYNSSCASVTAAFELLSLRGERFSALLSDMLELGAYSDLMHYELGKTAAKSHPERLYLFGEFANSTRRGAIDFGFPADKIFINPNLSNPVATARAIFEKYARN